jgi:Asp-tRNA(Asn)/Glu-tRNA(Gln) amidotransferase A subunit family amidase
MSLEAPSPDRRQLLQVLAALGIGTAAFQRAAVAQVAKPDDPPKKDEPKKDGPPARVTPEMVKEAEWVAGISLTDDERKAVAAALSRGLADRAAARKTELPNHVPPAFQFNPTPGEPPANGGRGTVTAPVVELKKPDAEDDLAFSTVAQLAHLIRTKQVSSVELTKLYLERLQKYDPALLCVVTLTDDLALRQARQADEELAAGLYRGPLHGIPWGAKDLIAYPGYKTTWGAGHYKEQTLYTKATVAKRLEDAGAVLVAKLTLGALAMGDQWFKGMTRNPWDIKQGSSGSSAGSASATAAGLVGFAIGSETSGSILSPSRVCRVTGLRPTFGRVSRYGCMTLCWTLDKIGPLARSAEDCALVLGAIHGSDGLDPTAITRPFRWPGRTDLKGVRVGYLENQGAVADRKELDVLKGLGATLVPVKLPGGNRTGGTLSTILNAETASAFEDITLQGVREGLGKGWPTTFRAGRFISAVDYLRANRQRTLLMREMAAVMEGVEVYVGRAYEFLTNLTGHPVVSVPNGEPGKKGDGPPAILFTGRLFGETELLAVAHAFQRETGYHLKRPPLEKATKENAGG